MPGSWGYRSLSNVSLFAESSASRSTLRPTSRIAVRAPDDSTAASCALVRMACSVGLSILKIPRKSCVIGARSFSIAKRLFRYSSVVNDASTAYAKNISLLRRRFAAARNVSAESKNRRPEAGLDRFRVKFRSLSGFGLATVFPFGFASLNLRTRDGDDLFCQRGETLEWRRLFRLLRLWHRDTITE